MFLVCLSLLLALNHTALSLSLFMPFPILYQNYFHITAQTDHVLANQYIAIGCVDGNKDGADDNHHQHLPSDRHT